MAVLMIGYELRAEPSDGYLQLFEAIKAAGSGWWHCLEGVWLVTTAKSTEEVRDALAPHLKRGDRLIVVACGDGAAWTGFSEERAYWLAENL